MTRAIDKAWDENLKLEEECQYKTKEELIEDCCPEYNVFQGIDLSPSLYCQGSYDKELCTMCWERDIESNKKSNKPKIPQIVHKDIIKSDNDRLKELHKEFIDTHSLNLQDALVLKKFLDFMLQHE